MTQTTLRSDIRTRVRDYLYEDTADIFTDVQLNHLIADEITSLPSKGIYLQEIWTTPLVVDQQDYELEEGTIGVEALEINMGTTAKPDWVEYKGWKVYQDALYLPDFPTTTDTIRAHLKKRFTNVTDDVTYLDIPDEIAEVVVWGTVIRAYKMVIGYLRSSKSWDSVTLPKSLSIPIIQAWLKDARQDYKELLEAYKIPQKPRDINLVS